MLVSRTHSVITISHLTVCVTPINTNFTCDITKVHHSQHTTCAMCYTPLLYMTIIWPTGNLQVHGTQLKGGFT